MRLTSPLLRLAAAIGLGLVIAVAAHAGASPTAERKRQKQQAESERAALRKKLADLKRDITRTETAKTHAADALAQSETAISDAKRSLRDLAQEQQTSQRELDVLNRQRAQLGRKVEAQQKQLAELVRQEYIAGGENRAKLLLSGDNPNRVGRELRYAGYVSEAQASLLTSLRGNLKAVEDNRRQAQETKQVLDDIALEEEGQKAALEKEKGKHAALVTQLSGKLAKQRKEAGNIERDEQRLSALVDKINVLIAQQRREAAAAAEAERRRQAQAKAKQKKLAQAKHGTKNGSPSRADAIDADENPAAAMAADELERGAGVQVALGATSFKAMRGKLRMPAKGDLLAKFGSRREDGPNWKGLFIRTAEGADVRAVAPGRVVFAEWLRGFGNLVIVDHGEQYMSIYANNQSILKREGDTVREAELIASAGNSGGNEHSGLYFEMRHQGRAIDPSSWMAGR